MARMIGAAAVLAAGVVATGCQAAHVVDVRMHGPMPKTTNVAVSEFDTSTVEWKGDHGEHTIAEVHGHFIEHLKSTLRQHGFTVAEGGGDGVAVGGRVVLVDAGSGSARMWLGAGAGQSKFVCTVELTAAGGGSPVCTFRVQGGTGGSGGWQKASYMSMADARDAAEKIVGFLDEQLK